MNGEIVGSYRIVDKLGAGGMGDVYLAEHVQIGKRVAVKMLHPDVSRNPDLVKRFFNEACATARIRHPGLVDVFDFGQHASGSAFILLEYLQGQTLADRIAAGPLPEEAVVAIARQIASAVGAAHAEGIVHRDLKPENLFLVPDRDIPIGLRVKVLDFGIAKLTGAGNVHTRTSAVFGTPFYMSPEQCRESTAVDERADIYSLGCILFEMCAGRRPFVQPSTFGLLKAHIEEPPPPLRSLAPDVNPRLEALVNQMLEKEADARPSSMDAVVAMLDGLRGVGSAGAPRDAVQADSGHEAPASKTDAEFDPLGATVGLGGDDGTRGQPRPVHVRTHYRRS